MADLDANHYIICWYSYILLAEARALIFPKRSTSFDGNATNVPSLGASLLIGPWELPHSGRFTSSGLKPLAAPLLSHAKFASLWVAALQSLAPPPGRFQTWMIVADTWYMVIQYQDCFPKRYEGSCLICKYPKFWSVLMLRSPPAASCFARWGVHVSLGQLCLCYKISVAIFTLPLAPEMLKAIGTYRNYHWIVIELLLTFKWFQCTWSF